MDEGFKKWLVKKAGRDTTPGKDFIALMEVIDPSLEILIKCMWAVNREWYYEGSRGRYLIRSSSHSYHLDFGCSNGIKNIERFGYRNCENNDSEQKALTTALNYIYKETK